MLDVRELSTSITNYPPAFAPPGTCIGGVNFSYLRKGLPVQQLGSQHLTVPFATGVPTIFPEILGRTTDVCRGLPQGAVLDAGAGYTLPAF